MDEPNFPCPKCQGTDLQAGTSSYEYAPRPTGAAGEGTVRELISATRNFVCRTCNHQFAVRHHYAQPKR
jgi:DNA-directed RNA polymerase subunit RPC12/RpoP